MKYALLLFVLGIGFISSCKKADSPFGESSSDSFLPLEIGNYWRAYSQDYKEVQDTVRIKGKLYYKVSSLVGGDAIGTEYLRIDENQNLISSSPGSPDRQYIEAKFNAQVGDSFQTLGDQSASDYKVTVAKKTGSKMTFVYDRIYRPNSIPRTHSVTFIRGFGWEERQWKTIRINGTVYSR